MRVKVNSKKFSDYLWGYLMIAPLTIGITIFALWPVFRTFYFSLTKWGPFGNYSYIGMTNYLKMFNNPEFYLCLKNTFIYTLVVPVSIVLSLLVAVLLNQKIKGVGLYRVLYFLPVVTMPTAIAMVWMWLYNGDYGIINYILSLVSIQGPRWLADKNTALFSIMIVSIWSSIGGNMILFLSGLQGISSTYYEAASIDGAGPLKQFFKITLPLLTPTIFFVSVMSLINAFQVFNLIYMMVGPDSFIVNSVKTIVYYFYLEGFREYHKGYASALVMILFVIIMVLTLIQFRMQKKWVHYE